MALGELMIGLDRVATQQAEGAGVRLDRKIGQPAENGVKEIEADATQSGFGAGPPGAAHDLGAVAPGGDKFRDDLGRVLQVGIHGHDGIGRAGVREAGGEGALETEIPGKLHEFEARIAGGLGPEEFGRAILAAVVDQNGPPRAAVPAVKERGEPGAELGDNLLFVEDRNNQSDGGDGARGLVHEATGGGAPMRLRADG